MSWDGREQPHCSAVPRVAEGDALMSLFCSLSAKLCASLARDATCESVLVERAIPVPGPKLPYDMRVGRAQVLLMSLSEKQKVMVRLVMDAPAGISARARKQWSRIHYRFVRCRVVKVVDAEMRDAHVWVRAVGSTSGYCLQLSRECIWNRLVVGWVYGGELYED